MEPIEGFIARPPDAFDQRKEDAAKRLRTEVRQRIQFSGPMGVVRLHAWLLDDLLTLLGVDQVTEDQRTSRKAIL